MTDGQFRSTQAYSNVGHAFAHLFMLIYPTVVIALESEFAAPFHQLIGLMLVGNILFGAAALPAGYLGDRWSAARMMVIFFIGTGSASILTGCATSPFQIAAGLALVGLFGSIYHPVGIAWIARRTVNRGRALGWNGVYGSIGVGLAPVLAGVITEYWSWRMAFVLPGLLCVLAGLSLWLAILRGRIVDEKADMRAMPAEAGTRDMRRAAFVLLITISCTGLIYQATSFALPKLFETRLAGLLDNNLALVGILVSAIYFVSGAAQIVGGWLADRFDLKRVYLVCWILQVPLLVIAASIDAALLIPVAAAMVVCNTLSAPSENSLFARYTPPRWRGTAFGIKFVLSLGVSAAAIPLIAWVYAMSGGFLWLLYGLATVALIAAGVSLLLPRSRTEARLHGIGRPQTDAAD